MQQKALNLSLMSPVLGSGLLIFRGLGSGCLGLMLTVSRAWARISGLCSHPLPAQQVQQSQKKEKKGGASYITAPVLQPEAQGFRV